ncbi:MAG: alkaline phosphatase family protein [Clostridia bacterium]|nr:alkaline phosphatase family protein [Clostridia bacterium]
MKKLLSIFLILSVLLTLVACGGEQSNGENTGLETDGLTDSLLNTGERFVYKHVIIVGIDGMGNFHTKTDTPNIDKLFADAALTDVARASDPSVTGPCWLSSFTGALPKEDMRVTQNPDDKTPNVNKRYEEALKKFPTIFTMTHDKYPDAKIASFVTWKQMNDYVVNDEDYINKEFLDWDDAKLTKRAVEYIKSDKPTLLFLHFDSVDSKGHKIGYETEEYLKQLTVVDGYLGEIYAAIEEAGILDDTLLILATDHGGTGTTHGKDSDAEMTITLGFKGKTVAPIKDFNMNLRDMAKVIAYALDLEDSPKFNDVKIPDGLFADIEK